MNMNLPTLYVKLWNKQAVIGIILQTQLTEYLTLSEDKENQKIQNNYFYSKEQGIVFKCILTNDYCSFVFVSLCSKWLQIMFNFT